MTLTEAKDRFLYEKQLKDCSKATVDDYHFFIKIFIDYLGDRDLTSLTMKDVENYTLSLYNRGLSKATHHTYLHHLRIFLNWCAKKEPLQFDPADISVPKSPKRKLRIYSYEDIRLIYTTDCTNDPVLNTRNRALISLMFDSGLRQKELCTIQRKDIDFSARRLKVRGKGDKERIVPIGRTTTVLIQRYMAITPYPDSKYLFCNSNGDPLTPNTVKLFMRKMASLLPFEFSSHKLRHNFATNYCINKIEKDGAVDTYSLMYIMGHESIETTERYVHLAREVIASKTCPSYADDVLDLLGVAV